MRQLSELERYQYIPSKPGYRLESLNDDVNLAACKKDRVPCAWCGELIDDHGFHTYCRSPHRHDLGLTSY